ncbi:hypothetical protein BBI01_07900 [Chryseobacterium artocarpi]|uniref:Uncharacterized protein n=1 Tax=Chryseobacterium artocarpi TaxID=1414727 RepID=A0A1B8ZKC8_9FLAO|nr:hypothetical protein BBI01_07900 [Chryseobacterium artocarpi]
MQSIYRERFRMIEEIFLDAKFLIRDSYIFKGVKMESISFILFKRMYYAYSFFSDKVVLLCFLNKAL